MQGYMISFAVTVANYGFSFSNKIVASERMPHSGEIRAMETELRDTHGASSVVALNIIPLEG